MVKVSNMQSPRGNDVPNQFVIVTDNGNRYFQSYRTVICRITAAGNITVDRESWDYSRTTMKYLSQFLNRPCKDIRHRIEHGIYKMGDLNR